MLVVRYEDEEEHKEEDGDVDHDIFVALGFDNGHELVVAI